MTLALILATASACAQPARNTATVSAPAAQVEEFAQGTLTQYQGKVVLLNFWAIWCSLCRTELPDMEAIYRKYNDQGAVVLAVNVAESNEDIIAFANKLNLTFPILRDSQRTGINTYGIRALPTTLFLNREGQVISRKVGALDQNSMSAEIEQLLD
jgi:thiol-disulfide isomerase/thioredoxin